MAITVEAIRLAMNAVAEATPETRRHRLRDLMTAKNEMTDLVAEHQQMLVDDESWLEDDLNWDDPTYAKVEERYFKRLTRYQEEHRVLGAALEMIAADGQVIGEPMREQLTL